MNQVPPPIRIAVVGTGVIGKRHIGSLNAAPIFDVVAAADPAPGAVEFLAAQGIPHFTDYRRMIEQLRPDGVIVATPNALHEEVALACIAHKIPALVEKPIADTLEAALRIAKAAGAAGVPILVGHHRRHNPMMKAARAFLDENRLGRIVSVAALDLRRKPDAYYQALWRREPGGGPMLINGIHDFDCLRWLCGEIETIYALTSNGARGFAVEDTAAVTIKFASGAVGNLTLSDAVQAPWAWEIVSGEEPEYPRAAEECYFICGTEGSMAVPSLTHWRNERGGGRADPFARKNLFYVPADPWVEELLHFARVIRGQERPLVSAQDGARTLATVLAVARSAATGLPVAVTDMYR
jgi:predicted dehydrogenase